MTNKLRSDADALKDINTTDAEKKQKSRLRNAVGATVLTVAGMVGFGVAGENDRQAEELTRQNNEQIMDTVTQKGGGSTPDIDVPVKGADGGSYVNEEGKHIEVVISPEGHEVHIDVATGQPVAEVTGDYHFIDGEAQPSTDQAAKEAEAYKNSDAFANNDGQASVDAERETNSDG